MSKPTRIEVVHEGDWGYHQRYGVIRHIWNVDELNLFAYCDCGRVLKNLDTELRIKKLAEENETFKPE